MELLERACVVWLLVVVILRQIKNTVRQAIYMSDYVGFDGRRTGLQVLQAAPHYH
jgi:hypothetical protein